MNVSWEKFGRNIQSARERLGMSIEELAAKAGTTCDYVIKTESGKKRVTLVMALSFCDALGIAPNELFMDVGT